MSAGEVAAQAQRACLGLDGGIAVEFGGVAGGLVNDSLNRVVGHGGGARAPRGEDVGEGG